VGTTHLRGKKERKGEKERRLEKGKRKKKGYPILSQSSSELAQHREIHARLSARMSRINQP
jgi:hypothetical protein